MGKNKKLPFKGKLVIIVGGSKGIGKATATELIRLGANVCIIARTLAVLEQVKEDLDEMKINKEQKIDIISADATNEEQLRPVLENFIDENGVPDVLINCVGAFYPNYIQNYQVSDFENALKINYMSVVIPTLIILPHFMKQRHGHIVNISSMGGFTGLIGYATYSPAKFAVVGFSESLRHELKPYIDVSVVYPPDTRTPGYKTENLTKPKEVKQMDEFAKIMEPEDVAKIIIKGIRKKKFNILPGSAGWIYWVKRHLPRVFFWYMDRMLKKIRKKLGKG